MESVSRVVNAEKIARQVGWVRRLDENSYKVHSQTRQLEYDVISKATGWSCTCPDFTYRAIECKHIRAVELSFILRTVVATEPVVIQPINPTGCPRCNSESIKRAGIRHNKAGDLQKFRCRSCGYWFTVNLGFERMRASPQAITQAMQLYFTGESLRNVQKFLALQGVKVSHVCIYKWIGKYVKLMDSYLEKITPKVGDKWRSDEMFLKVKGNPKWLYAMIDDETRFWIAKQVGDRKWHEDVRPMFKEAQEVAGKNPKILISDGAWNFATAARKEWWTRYPQTRTTHIRDITFHGQPHNNKMERFNGELRDREKVMRNLKREDSPILKGMQIHHNFVRSHMGLNGDTPADRAGIKVEGENKWMTLIQNASKRKST